MKLSEVGKSVRELLLFPSGSQAFARWPTTDACSLHQILTYPCSGPDAAIELCMEPSTAPERRESLAFDPSEVRMSRLGH